MPCVSCGGPLYKVREGLDKCHFCGQYHGPGGMVSSLKVFPDIDRIREHAVIGRAVVQAPLEVDEPEGLPEDLLIFGNRLTVRLSPTVGYTPEIVEQILKEREEYRKGLLEVFDGKREWQNWFDRTKTKKGLHRHTFMTMIIESLEGLTHPEAVELKIAYEEAMRGGLLG